MFTARSHPFQQIRTCAHSHIHCTESAWHRKEDRTSGALRHQMRTAGTKPSHFQFQMEAVSVKHPVRQVPFRPRDSTTPSTAWCTVGKGDARARAGTTRRRGRIHQRHCIAMCVYFAWMLRWRDGGGGRLSLIKTCASICARNLPPAPAASTAARCCCDIYCCCCCCCC